MNRTHIGLGIFVVGTLGLLFWLAQSIGAIGGGGGDVYRVRLEHAAGLVENNAVKIAGVGVGKIERIEVDHDVAVLVLRVRDDIVLHEDARAIVRAKSLLGEKYLQLEPGQREAAVLEPGGEISDVDVPFEMDEVLNSLQPLLSGENSIAGSVAPLADSVVPLADTLNDLLTDATGKNGSEPLMTRKEITQMLADVGATTASLRRITEGNEEKIGRIVSNADRLLADPRLPHTIAKVDNLVTTLDQRLPAVLDRTEKTLERLEKLANVVDADRAAKIGKIIDNTEVASANLKKLSADLDGVSKTFKPLLENLTILATRAAAIDGDLVRQFLQNEGMKVFFGTKWEAARALEEAK